jgi:hypothetical protein
VSRRPSAVGRPAVVGGGAPPRRIRGLRASTAMRSKGAGAAGAAVVTKDADCGLRAIVKNSGAPRRVAMVPSVKP